MSTIKQDLLNLPNMLTLFRIMVIPITCMWLLEADPLSCLGASLLFGAAAVTDFVDGRIARARNLVTLTGKFLDPLADKLIVMAVLVVMVELQWIPAWLVVLVLTREIAITALRSIASNEGIVIAAGTTGKYKTAFQLTGLYGLMIHYEYPVDFLLFESTVNFHVVGAVLFGVSVLFSLWSGLEYLVGFYRGIEARGVSA
jgi:CDP-diacylglycerol---glycerol-3-phosphate 3-phosphatidyltransferase